MLIDDDGAGPVMMSEADLFDLYDAISDVSNPGATAARRTQGAADLSTPVRPAARVRSSVDESAAAAAAAAVDVKEKAAPAPAPAPAAPVNRVADTTPVMKPVVEPTAIATAPPEKSPIVKRKPQPSAESAAAQALVAAAPPPPPPPAAAPAAADVKAAIAEPAPARQPVPVVVPEVSAKHADPVKPRSPSPEPRDPRRARRLPATTEAPAVDAPPPAKVKPAPIEGLSSPPSPPHKQPQPPPPTAPAPVTSSPLVEGSLLPTTNAEARTDNVTRAAATPPGEPTAVHATPPVRARDAVPVEDGEKSRQRSDSREEPRMPELSKKEKEEEKKDKTAPKEVPETRDVDVDTVPALPTPLRTDARQDSEKPDAETPDANAVAASAAEVTARPSVIARRRASAPTTPKRKPSTTVLATTTTTTVHKTPVKGGGSAVDTAAAASPPTEPVAHHRPTPRLAKSTTYAAAPTSLTSVPRTGPRRSLGTPLAEAQGPARKSNFLTSPSSTVTTTTASSATGSKKSKKPKTASTSATATTRTDAPTSTRRSTLNRKPLRASQGTLDDAAMEAMLHDLLQSPTDGRHTDAGHGAPSTKSPTLTAPVASREEAERRRQQRQKVLAMYDRNGHRLQAKEEEGPHKSEVHSRQTPKTPVNK